MREPLSFVNLTIKDAYGLLQATHDYVKWQAPLDVDEISEEDAFKISCETMRITVRMSQVISWLMLQKALIEGDISQEDALSEDFRVLRGKTCLDENAEVDSELPPRLRELLEESRHFYLRMLRLDEMARNQFLSNE